MLIGLSLTLLIYFGGLGVLNKTFTAGMLVEFVMYINMLTFPVASLGWVISLVQRAAASQKRINQFLLTEPKIKSTVENGMVIKGQITFKNVSFTYPNSNNTAIKNLSIELKAGQPVSAKQSILLHLMLLMVKL